MQILTGDFNAEPDEPSYAFLTGTAFQFDEKDSSQTRACEETCEEQAHTISQETESERGDFVDAWLVASGGVEDEGGFTFPPCKPEKRIDFILVRNNTHTTVRYV